VKLDHLKLRQWSKVEKTHVIKVLAQLGDIKFHRGFPLLFFLFLHGEIDINMTTE